MLKYKRDDETVELEFDGNLPQIVTEVSFMIRKVYEAVKEKDAELAEEFKHMTANVVGNEESPVWDDYKSVAKRLMDKLKKIIGSDEE